MKYESQGAIRALIRVPGERKSAVVNQTVAEWQAEQERMRADYEAYIGFKPSEKATQDAVDLEALRLKGDTGAFMAVLRRRAVDRVRDLAGGL